jgi:RNA polymerase sigma-70 factor (ECF subfamily)
LRNKQDAEDAVQDAFLSAHRHHRDFEGRAALATWLTRIVMNAALMLRRKRANLLLDSIQEHGVHTPQWTETIAAPQPDPESLCAGKEAHETIQHSLNRMAPLLRQAFVMTYFEELPLKESSARLGVPLSTFKARLFRAKRQLIGKTKISLPILSPKNVEFSVRLKNRTLPTFREFHTESPSYGFDSAATD